MLKLKSQQFCCVLILSLFIISCQAPDKDLHTLEKNLRKEMNQVKGAFALAYQNLSDTSDYLFIREKEMFHAASTMKTPVLYELFKQQAAGELNLTDSILIKNEFRSIVDASLYSMDIEVDSGDAFYDQIGQKASLYDLAYAMITQSNNLATNLLIDKVVAKKVTRSMRDIGAKDIQVLRGVEDLKAFDAGLSNRTSAYDLMLLFRDLGHYQLVDSISSQQMIDILLAQKFNEIIPAKLPSEVKVAHKTGSITKVMHDSGLILLPDGKKYVLVLLSKDWEDEDKTRTLLSELSYLVYTYYTAH
jgi:beta-lactamase class A